MNLDNLETVISKSFPTTNKATASSGRGAHHPSRRYRQITEDLLFLDQSYQAWENCETSSLFFLSGQTWPDARLERSGTCSWLSKASSIIVNRPSTSIAGSEKDTRLGNSETLCVFYTFHPEFRYDKCQTQGPVELLGHILFRLLAWKPAILRHKLPDYLSRLSLAKQYNQSERIKALQQMMDLLHEVHALLPRNANRETTQRVYLIIDRLDLCDDLGGVKLHHLMSEIARLVGIDSCVVKILVVVDAAWANSDWDADYLDTKLRERIYCRKDWDQTSFPSYERYVNNHMKI